MKKYMINIYVLAGLLLLTCNLPAQVTIGSEEAPADGMLLQLKPSAGNKAGGFLLPRVRLTVEGELAPFLNPADFSATDYETEKKEHQGLIVYNLNSVFPFCPGLYVWNNVKWVSLKSDLKALETAETFDPTLDTEGTVTSQDGQVYTVSKFGAAGWWTTQNIRTKKLYTPCGVENIAVMAGAASASTTEPRFGYVNKHGGSLSDATFFETHSEYGLYYNWMAAAGGQSSDLDGVNVQGVCPEGWHLPTDTELSALESEIYDRAELYSSYPAGSFTPATWDGTTTPGARNAHSGWRGSTNNNDGVGAFNASNPLTPPVVIKAEGHGRAMTSDQALEGLPSGGKSTVTGFKAFLIGYGVQGGTAQSFQSVSHFWSSTHDQATGLAWRTAVIKGTGGTTRYQDPMADLFSVRCKRNDL